MNKGELEREVALQIGDLVMKNIGLMLEIRGLKAEAEKDLKGRIGEQKQRDTEKQKKSKRKPIRRP